MPEKKQKSKVEQLNFYPCFLDMLIENALRPLDSFNDLIFELTIHTDATEEASTGTSIQAINEVQGVLISECQRRTHQ